MPIPQLSNKKSQGWRTSKKKYYVSRGAKPGVLKIKKNKPTFGKKRNSGRFTKKFKKNLYIFGTAFILAVILVSLIYVAWISRGLPDPNRLIEREIAQTTKIYDRTGEKVLYEIQ